MKHRGISPLRYPGGKAKLTNYIADLIDSNNLQHCTYIEVFAGGAGAALALLQNQKVDNIVINDYDNGIYSFWSSVLDYTEEFCNMIENTPITMDEWHNQRIINKTSDNVLDLGFSTFFLNRTNRSGIIKGGVIGGTKQEGNFKLDCRFNKDDLINRIRKIADFKDRINLYNQDAEDFILNELPNHRDNALIYFDPPYYKKGPELYTNFYSHEDHRKLAEIISGNVVQPWIMTYDNNEIIAEFYKEFQQTKYLLNYSAKEKYKGQEIIIFSNNILPIISSNIEYCN